MPPGKPRLRRRTGRSIEGRIRTDSARGATLPETWSETENVVWKSHVPDWGWSSPIVWGNRAFVTPAVGEKELPVPHVGGYPGGHLRQDDVHRWMLCGLHFDSGTIVWVFQAHQGIPPMERHPRNSYASETPVTDGEPRQTPCLQL